MRMAEVERWEGVGGAISSLIRLWECVEKLRTIPIRTPVCGTRQPLWRLVSSDDKTGLCWAYANSQT